MKKKLFITVLMLIRVYSMQASKSWTALEWQKPFSLIEAIQNKQPLHTIRQLIMEGEDVNAIDFEFLRYVNPVLRYALDRGTDEESVEIIKMLISNGANVNKVTYNRVSDEKLYGMMPLLTYATIYSSAEIVRILIDAGAKDTIVPGPLNFEKTALMIAQELEKSEVVFAHLSN